MTRKRGKLSTKEEEHIKKAIEGGLTFDTIAVQLNRTAQTIERYCNDNNLTYSGMSEDIYDETILRARLEERPYWLEVKMQFSERELDYFAITWIRIMKQFREDILYAEEMQLKQWITLEIMANKVMRDRLGTQGQITRLEETLAREYALDEEVRDATIIAQYEQEIAMLRNSQGSYTTEHSKILDRIEKIQKDLKAARSDRVKRVEDSKTSFAGFLKALEDEDLRKKIGEDIEINKMAKDKAIEHLSEYHKYDDGQIDQPFLNCDTAKD